MPVQKLTQQGEITLQAGEPVRLDPSLRLPGGSVVAPNHVEATDCLWLDSDEDPNSPTFGTFRIQNATDAEQTVRWVATYDHSIQRNSKRALQTDLGPLGLQPAPPAVALDGGGGGGGSGGFFESTVEVYISPTHPGAADDGDLATPFITWGDAMLAIGPPVDAADAARHFAVFVEPGQYNEPPILPAGRQMAIWALGGGVILGVVDEGAVTITTPQDLTILTDGNEEQGSVRPKYRLGVLNPPQVSTGQQGLQGFWITGSLIMQGVPGGDPATTIDLDLNGVKISGPGIIQAPIDPHTGGLNIYLQRCFFDNAISISHLSGILNAAMEVEVDGVIVVDSIGRFFMCQIQGDITAPSGLNTLVPPTGFFSCDFSGGLTFSLGAGPNFKVDAYSNFTAKAAAVGLAGGTTKLIAGDVTP